MNTKRGNEQAMPGFEYMAGYGCSKRIVHPDGQVDWLHYQTGLTIREHFAAMAMNSILVRTLYDQDVEDDFISKGNKAEDLPKFAAMLAVESADALIAELAKEQKP